MSMDNLQTPMPHYQQPPAKKSPILLVIVVIVVVVVVVLAGLYVWVIASGPNDPFAGYTIDIDGYFNGLDGLNTEGIVNQRMGYRLRPLGAMSYADRLYVGGGDGSPISPYGLYAYDTEDGFPEWTAMAFETTNPISSDVVVVNFGSTANPDYADIRIFFGCEGGTIFMLKDDFDGPRSLYPPYGDYTWNDQLDGEIAGIAVYHERDGVWDDDDLYFASTNAGTLYAYNGYNINLWSSTISSHGLTAPTISADGTYVFVGSRDGKLYGLQVATGLPIPEWAGEEYTVSDSYWSSSPVCSGGIGEPPIIYLTTDDGHLHSVWGQNGAPRTGWEGGLQIRNSNDQIDGGKLTDPQVTPDGYTILFGSSTGYVYSLSANGNLNKDFDTSVGALDTECIVAPYYDYKFSKYLFIAVNCPNGTSNPNDDFTFLYCLNSQFNVTWRMSLEGMVLAPPISYCPYGLVDHLYSADVVLATVNIDAYGTQSAGRMYSFASSGTMVPI